MENSSELAGRLLFSGALVASALYFLVRASGAAPRSRRLANTALACGLGALAVPLHMSGLLPVILRAGLGVACLGLAVAALVARRDGGCGIIRPAIGVVLGLAQLANAGALLMFSSFTSPSTPWIYRAPDSSYELTLPSGRWEQAHTKPAPNGAQQIIFVHAVPHMQAAILSVKNGQSEDDFVKAAASAWSFLVSDPKRGATARSREGTNAAGNAYRYFTTMDSGDNASQIFVGQSFTWIRDKQLVVQILFEGPRKMLSEMGARAEMEAFENSANSICLSVK